MNNAQRGERENIIKQGLLDSGLDVLCGSPSDRQVRGRAFQFQEKKTYKSAKAPNTMTYLGYCDSWEMTTACRVIWRAAEDKVI